MKTSSTVVSNHDAQYQQVEELISDRIATHRGPVFRTDVNVRTRLNGSPDSDALTDRLWAAYIEALPPEVRQHYTCHSCRRFIQRFGGLVGINPSTGVAVPLLWDPKSVPELFRGAFERLDQLVQQARVIGVFRWNRKEQIWGQKEAGGWSHLYGVPARAQGESPRNKAGEEMAELVQDFRITNNALRTFPIEVARQAVTILSADAVSRSEKALGHAQWFLTLHEDVVGKKRALRENVVWAAVATAPKGYAHIRASMIGTLLDDLLAGRPIETIRRKWAEKMNPLQYRRPTAAPKLQSIQRAEQLVEELGVRRALERRYATLDDVLEKLWTPPVVMPAQGSEGGVFDHLRADKRPLRELHLPEKPITWEKFQERVLPTAEKILVKAPARGAYYGLVTAVDPDAPAIIQWDGLEGHPRNPVSWYFHAYGSTAGQWDLTAGWTPVAAVFRPPHRWQEPDRFQHFEDQVFFGLEGARDLDTTVGIGLFPEILRSEFHSIRSVVEAHSNKQNLEQRVATGAHGLALTAGSKVQVRVTTKDGVADYLIDRME